MTTTPTLDHLLAAICANPDDDTPRLMYADELDAMDPVRVNCPKCNGESKRQRGYCNAFMYGCDEFGDDNCSHKTELILCGCDAGNLDTSNADRAEFIRVQCEIARHPTTSEQCPGCGYKPRDDYHHNRPDCPYVREEKLLAHADRWRTGVLLERRVHEINGDTRLGEFLVRINHYERGFPAVVTMPLKTFVQPGFAAKLLRQVPLRKGGIRLSDREPDHEEDNLWRWYEGDPDDGCDTLPSFLFRLMPASDGEGHEWVSTSAELAHETLALAAWQWAWEQAFGIAPKEISV